MTRLVPSALVFLALLGGFGVAELTDSRPAGGIVMLVLALIAAGVLLRSAGLIRTLLVGLAFVVLFVVSHSLAGLIGAWPSAILVALIAALAAFWATRSRSVMEAAR